MTLPTLSREWCSTGTKTDPGAAAALTGFVAGNPVSSASHNYLLNQLSVAQRRMLAIAACATREIRLDGTAISDTANSCGVVGVGEGYRILAIKTAQALAIQDGYRFGVAGVPASITSLVTDAAYSPSLGRIVAIGTGGNRCTYSDTLGTSWNAGGDIGNTPGYIVWNATHSKFIVTANSAIKYSSNAASWTAASSAAETAGGLAIMSGGDTFYMQADAQISRSTDGGVTWGTAAHLLPNHASFDEAGTLAGSARSYIYHAARLNSGASLQISASSNVGVWAVVATFAPPTGYTYSARPRIMCCQNTGAVWVVAPITNGTTSECVVRACPEGGAASLPRWTDRLFAPAATTAGFGVAGGRLVCSLGAQLFASDGIGWS